MERRAPVPVEVLLSQREWVRSLARRLTADDAAADDLAQEAWVDALRSPPARDAGIRGWFATLLRRRARDAWRGASRRERREGAAARPGASRATAEVVAEAEAHRLVVEAALALEEPYRETILLRFFEDLPPRAIAARQGVPVETVRTRTRRALERLRERLDAGQGGDRSRWAALLLPLALPAGEGAGAATGNAAAAASIAGGAVMGTKAAVAGGAAVAAALALLAGGMLLTGEEPPPLPPSAPAPEEGGALAAAAPPSPRIREPVPPPAPSPAPPPAPARPPAAPAAAPPAEEPAAPRLLLKGRVRDPDGDGVAGVDLVAFLEDSPIVPPPAGARFEEKEDEDLRTFYAQVARDRGKGSVRGRSDHDGTFLLELPAKGRYALVAFARRVLVLPERGSSLRDLLPGAVVHLRAFTVPDLQRIARDERRPADERIEALSRLAGVKGGRSEEVAASMAVLFRELRSLKEPTLRADLLRCFLGEPPRVLLPVLLEALRDDPSEEVRGAAALVLAGLLDDPLVRPALEAAREGDASAAVRAKAAEAIRNPAQFNRR